MHWNPGKATVDLHQAGAKPRPSIRRDPGRLPEHALRLRRSDEAETWLGIGGILAITAAVVALIVGIAWATYSKPGAPVTRESATRR